MQSGWVAVCLRFWVFFPLHRIFLFKPEERWLEKAIIEVYKIKDYLGKVNKEQQFPLSSIIRSKDT